MNLPNCPCRSTVTGLQSTTTGSLGLLVPTSVSPTVVAVSRHARCRRRIEAPKIRKFLVVVRRFSGVLGDRGWSEIVAGDVRNQFQVVVRHKPGGINGDENGSWPRLSSFNRRRSGRFPATRTAGYVGRLPSFRSVPSTAGEVAGNGRTSRVKLRVTRSRIRVKRVKILSLLYSLSLKIENSFPVITFCSFFLSLIQIKLISDPRRK